MVDLKTQAMKPIVQLRVHKSMRPLCDFSDFEHLKQKTVNGNGSAS